MTNPSGQARLVYCESERPAIILGNYLLTGQSVTFGRTAEGKPEPDIKLELQSISRGIHARIVREGGDYLIESLSDKGVQLYDRALMRQNRARLSAIDYFSLPANRQPGERHYTFCFAIPNEMTLRNNRVLAPLPFTAKVEVYGKTIALTPYEYKILLQLDKYGSCTYAELRDRVWGERQGKLADVDDSLRHHLLNLRKKLRYRTDTPPPTPRWQRHSDGADEEQEGLPHCFLTIEWGERVTLRLEDVIAELSRSLSLPAIRILEKSAQPAEEPCDD